MRRPLVAAVALALTLALADVALAAFPGANGRIAFSRSVGPRFDYDIYTMRPDGTGQRGVVTSRFADLDPSWSADGRQLVFVRDVDRRMARANNEIFTKNLVTGVVERHTTSPAIDWNPVFSPDGGSIAFSSDRGPGLEYDIFILDLTTGDLQRLHRDGDDFAPAWSSDGDFVLWSGYRPNGRADLFRLELFGGVLENVTGTRRLSEEEPNLSPAGTHVAYQRWGIGAAAADPEIVIRNLVTGATRMLTHNRRSDLRPAFSPGGRRIVWERSWENTDTSSRAWTMHDNGSHKRARTPRRFDADSPDWQPRP